MDDKSNQPPTPLIIVRWSNNWRAHRTEHAAIIEALASGQTQFSLCRVPANLFEVHPIDGEVSWSPAPESSEGHWGRVEHSREDLFTAVECALTAARTGFTALGIDAEDESREALLAAFELLEGAVI